MTPAYSVFAARHGSVLNMNAKANGLEPCEDLRHVHMHIAAADTVEKIEALQPLNMKRIECNNAGSLALKLIQTFEVRVGMNNGNEYTGLWQERIEYVDIVKRTIGDTDKRWDIALQIEQHMQIECGLGFSR